MWHDRGVTESDLIRTGEAAAILGSSRQHIVDLCELGRLPFERSPTHRRLRRRDVEAFADRLRLPRRLDRDQRQSLWLHAAVAGRLAIDPAGTLERAQNNLGRLRREHPTGAVTRSFDAWESSLSRGPEAVMEILTSLAAQAVELRQNSPFAGVLTDHERIAVLRAFRENEQRAE